MEKKELNDWLNKLVGSEINAMLQYDIAAELVEDKDVKSEFLQHANEEREHFKKLLKISKKLEVRIDTGIKALVKNSYPEYETMNFKDDNNLTKFHLESEKGAIKAYSEFFKLIKEENEELKELIKEIIKDEEEHERDLKKLYKKPIKKIFNY